MWRVRALCSRSLPHVVCNFMFCTFSLFFLFFSLAVMPAAVPCPSLWACIQCVLRSCVKSYDVDVCECNEQSEPNRSSNAVVV